MDACKGGQMEAMLSMIANTLHGKDDDGVVQRQMSNMSRPSRGTAKMVLMYERMYAEAGESRNQVVKACSSNTTGAAAAYQTHWN